MIVDLGCGIHKRGDIGIDCKEQPGVDIVCFLGFEQIPLEDNIADRVMAFDILEHIPASVYYREGNEWKVKRPRIDLFREVHRILKPGGEFESFTPCFPHETWALDPTHEAPPWTDTTFLYFSTREDYKHLQDYYNIDFQFEVVKTELDMTYGGHISAILRKPG